MATQLPRALPGSPERARALLGSPGLPWALPGSPGSPGSPGLSWLSRALPGFKSCIVLYNCMLARLLSTRGIKGEGLELLRSPWHLIGHSHIYNIKIYIYKQCLRETKTKALQLFRKFKSDTLFSPTRKQYPHTKARYRCLTQSDPLRHDSIACFCSYEFAVTTASILFTGTAAELSYSISQRRSSSSLHLEASSYSVEAPWPLSSR